MNDSLSSPILVTSALPYANGAIHIGHLVEYIQTDIFVRFLRLIGRDPVYVCADDTHGSAIQIKAKTLGISPEDLITQYSEEHQRDFRDFQINFDCYYTTHSEENLKHVLNIYNRLSEAGHIFTADVDQYYCEHDSMFLPDRFIRGICPNPSCAAVDQYGDSCEVCGLHYDSTDLLEPRCATCDTTPIRRSSKHYFFRLKDFASCLKLWTSDPNHLQEETRNSIREWLEQGLKDWDISRDAPYFGFRIPGEQHKYFYVWLDAPVGYIAATERFAKESGRDFDSYWHNPGSTIYHFIGKDIVYFHTLFWPAMLMGSDYTPPSSVFVHGFLTVNGKKMSKARGTFVNARTYLDYLDPQHLRYYYATKLTGHADDLDLNTDDFVFKVNSELVNKIVNLGSRIGPLLCKTLGGRVGTMDEEGLALFKEMLKRLPLIKSDYEAREFARVIRAAVEAADAANRYINDRAPWNLIKADPERARQACALGVHALKFVMTILKPVLPKMALETERFLNLPSQSWSDIGNTTPDHHLIGEFRRLSDRVDANQVKAMMEASQVKVG